MGPDKAEDEDFGDSKARTTTQYGPIFTATRRAGANFPDFRVAPHSLNSEKLAPSADTPELDDRP